MPALHRNDAAAGRNLTKVTSMNSKKLSAALLVTLPLLATPALADFHSSPGAVCQLNSTSSQPANFISYFSSGRAFNSSGGTLGFICPLEHNINPTNVNESVSLTVYAVAANYDAPVCCTATIRDITGATLAASARECTRDASPTNTEPISLSVPTVSTVTGYTTVYCTVPGLYFGNGSGIASIYYAE